MQNRIILTIMVWSYTLLAVSLQQPRVSLANSSDSLLEYRWSHRLLVVSEHAASNDLREKAQLFFTRYRCETEERHMLLLTFEAGTLWSETLPKEMRSQTGMWLVGYDGRIKAFSEDARILKQIFHIIDTMPMRQQEIQQSPPQC